MLALIHGLLHLVSLSSAKKFPDLPAYYISTYYKEGKSLVQIDTKFALSLQWN